MLTKMKLKDPVLLGFKDVRSWFVDRLCVRLVPRALIFLDLYEVNH